MTIKELKARVKQYEMAVEGGVCLLYNRETGLEDKNEEPEDREEGTKTKKKRQTGKDGANSKI